MACRQQDFCVHVTHIEDNKMQAGTMQLYKAIIFQKSKFWGIKKSGEQGAIQGSIKFRSMKAAEESKHHN